MSATELIEEAKRLSRQDRERLIESLLEFDLPSDASTTAERTVDWSGMAERAKNILGGRVLENVILEERQSYTH